LEISKAMDAFPEGKFQETMAYLQSLSSLEKISH
jgi:hypothetical protein